MAVTFMPLVDNDGTKQVLFVAEGTDVWTNYPDHTDKMGTCPTICPELPPIEPWPPIVEPQ